MFEDGNIIKSYESHEGGIVCSTTTETISLDEVLDGLRELSEFFSGNGGMEEVACLVENAFESLDEGARGIVSALEGDQRANMPAQESLETAWKCLSDSIEEYEALVRPLMSRLEMTHEALESFDADED